MYGEPPNLVVKMGGKADQLASMESDDVLNLSPNSRTMAILRGQWELMEMVKNMPESSYELTLKDLVQTQTSLSPQDTMKHARDWEGVKIKKIDKNMIRNGSFANKGVFLNMVFPFSSLNPNNNINKKKIKGIASESSLWKRRSKVSSNSTTDCSSSSDGIGRRRNDDFQSGCWPCFIRLHNHNKDRSVV